MTRHILRTLIIIWVMLLPYRFALASDKTLNRTVDQVVIQGKKIPDAAGTKLAFLSMFAYVNGKLETMPFQVDEKTPKGDYAFTKWHIGKPVRDDGKWDSNDELVFMAADMGGRAEPFPWPDGAIVCFELEAHDPVDGGKAYAYLCSFSGPGPKSKIDYVRLDVAKDEIETVDYVVGYDPKAPISLSKLQVKKEFGGQGADVADRLKIRVKAEAAMGLFELDRNEEDFIVENVAYIDGPVRVIRLSKAWQKLFWNIPTPSSLQFTTYYRNAVEFPMTVNIPFDVSLFFKNLSMRVSIDTPDNVPGLRRYYNNNNPKGVAVDGVMSPAEINMDRRHVKWQVIAGTTPEHPEGWLALQTIKTDNKSPISFSLYYQDDINKPDPPENIPGCYGNLGFEFTGVDSFKKGRMEMMVKQYPVLNYKPGDEIEYIQINSRPLRFSVKSLTR